MHLIACERLCVYKNVMLRETITIVLTRYMINANSRDS